MIQEIPDFTKLAYQYGPFFFAVLFTLVTTGIARKFYNKVVTREKPIPTDREKNTHRIIYFVTFSVGILLVLLSVIWWICNQPKFYVYQGKILNLSDYAFITSESLYFNCELIQKPYDNAPQLRNEKFLFIQNRPFDQNQKFTVHFCRGEEGKQEALGLPFLSEPYPEFVIKFDSSLEKSVLMPKKVLDEHPNPTDIDQSTTMYAFGAAGFLKTEDIAFISNQKKELNTRLFYLLQQERASIEEKIRVLIELNSIDPQTLTEYLKHDIGEEPLIVTLMDLGRHSDEELAYRANAILDKLDLKDILADYLVSPDNRIRQKSKYILLRMEKEKANQIIKEIESSHQDIDLSKVREEVHVIQNPKVLIPTGSAQGDRYYVLAEWDPNNQEVHTCLTRMFHENLISKRTLEEEERIMRGRNNRLVYWYSKDWAISIAEKIRECGGTAKFVNPWEKRK